LTETGREYKRDEVGTSGRARPVCTEALIFIYLHLFFLLPVHNMVIFLEVSSHIDIVEPFNRVNGYYVYKTVIDIYLKA